MVAEFEPSTYILMWADPRRNWFEEITRGESKICDDGKADSRLLPVVPYRPTPRIFKSKDYLEIHLILPSADTIVTADSYVRVPVTIKNTRLNVKNPDFVTAGLTKGAREFSDNSDGLVFLANAEKMAWYYQVPDNTELVIGHVAPFNSRMLIAPYDDTA